MGAATDFDGPAGRVAGAVMARRNRDMEVAAVAELHPGPEDSVLAVGFGPGVGISELVRHLPRGKVAGIDPSAVMVSQATRRNRRRRLGARHPRPADVASIPWPDAAFTGVLAVNSMQLWQPLDVTLREVARVLAPSGALVASRTGGPLRSAAAGPVDRHDEHVPGGLRFRGHHPSHRAVPLG